MAETESIQTQDALTPETQASSEAEPYVIDGMLAARCFIVGMKTAEKHIKFAERMDAFVGVITEQYPAVDKHVEVKKLRDAFVRVAIKEAKKDGRI